MMKYTGRKIMLLVLAILSVEAVKAQTDPLTKTFLRKFIGEKDIVYENYTLPYTVSEMLKSLGLDSADDSEKYYAKNTLQLNFTTAEKSYLTAEIKKLKDVVWGNDIFDNGKAVTLDTINSIFGIKKDGWGDFRKRYGNKIFAFTRPIYLRNGTLCFFYNDYSCSSLCGEGRFAVYEKQNGVWVVKMELYRWIS